MTHHQKTPQKSMLIVEDNMFLAMDAEEVLMAHGFHIAGVTGRVKEALKILNANRVDGVLLDYQLVDGTSEPVAQALTKAQIPFVLLSGTPIDVLKQRGFDERYIVAKPADLEQVIEKHLLAA